MTNARPIPPRLLDELGEAERRAVLAEMVRRRFRRTEVVFHEGDPGETVHVIDSGRVAIGMSTRLGEQATLAILGPGDAFGEQALLGEGHRTATAVALEPVETLMLHADRFHELRRTLPAVDRFLVYALASQVRRLSEYVLESLFVPVETRVLRRLVMLCEVYGANDGAVVIPLTQDDVALLAGTTRPTANRILHAAAAEGLVRLGRGKVEVPDPAALAGRAR